LEKISRWNDNINTAFKDFMSGSMYPIHLIQDTVQRRQLYTLVFHNRQGSAVKLLAS
jgi:hypothetical protein